MGRRRDRCRPAWGDQTPPQAEQQGQPAASWGQSDQSDDRTVGGVGRPGRSRARDAVRPGAPPGSTPATPAHEETQVWGGRTEGGTTPEATPGESRQPGEAGASSEEERKDDDNRRRSRAGGSSRPSSRCRLDHSRQSSAADLGFAAPLHDGESDRSDRPSPFGSGRNGPNGCSARISAACRGLFLPSGLTAPY